MGTPCHETALGRWLTSRGASYASSLFFEAEPSGQAVHTCEDIPADTTLAFCPFELCITPRSARAALWEYRGESAINLDDHRAMCLYLALHKLSPASECLLHSEYIGSLPRPDQMGTAMYFGAEERMLLRGTNLYGAIQEREASWRAEAASLTDVIGQELPYELWLWCSTILSSRAFPSSLIPGYPGQSTPVLFPGVDAFNHRRAQKVSWISTATGLELRTDAPLRKGTEVFNNYGAKSNEEWLLGYGFVLPDNPEDTIAVKLGYPRGTDTDWDERLRAAGLTTDLRHSIGRDGRIPEDLLGQMRVFLRTDPDDLALELDVLGQLCEMLTLKLTALDVGEEELLADLETQTTSKRVKLNGEHAYNESRFIRPEVARICTIYRQGQLDCARAALEKVERLYDEAESRVGMQT